MGALMLIRYRLVVDRCIPLRGDDATTICWWIKLDGNIFQAIEFTLDCTFCCKPLLHVNKAKVAAMLPSKGLRGGRGGGGAKPLLSEIGGVRKRLLGNKSIISS